MSRTAPFNPVSAKMYRHFAILTLVITGCIAMFASGERRQAVEDHLEERMAEREAMKKLKQEELKLAIQGKGGNTSLVFKDERKNTQGWSSDEMSPQENYIDTSLLEEPREIAGASYFDRTKDPTLAMGEYENPTAPPPGMSQEEFQEILRRKGLRKAPKKKMAEKAGLNSMLERSRARSGVFELE